MSINLLDQSGFSEYESIGTFVAKNYPDKIFFNNERWERRGTQIFREKNISFSSLDLFAKVNPDLFFISFEQWNS